MTLIKLLIILSWLSWHSPVQSQDISDGFSVQAIPDSIWQHMQGKSYRPNPHIGRADLRYLRVRHYDYDGKTHDGEIICNRLIADKVLKIFQELYIHHYPIQRIRLTDDYDGDDERQMRDNNTSCFNYRTVSGSQKLSYHARGLAIDINPLYNPFIRKRKDGSIEVQPTTARPYMRRNRPHSYIIQKGDLCYRLFIKYGFTWGGDWKSSKDYQHFEYNKKILP